MNPERPWPALDRLRAATEAAGIVLAPRLTVYPEYVRDPTTWLHPDVRTPVLVASDLEGLARDDRVVAGPRRPRAAARCCPRRAPARARRRRSARCSTACSRARRSASTRSSRCSARAVPRSRAVAEVADELRREIVGDEVTFVRNRNINYTNVCTFKCRFCAFSKGPLSLNLRGKPYLLELEEMQRRVVEAVECGATEVCLQGGIHPDFDGDYYVDVARAVKEVAPDDPRARLHRARGHRRRAPARHAARATTCCALKDAGLATLPGTAAEILDDEVRAVICPDKVNTEEWLDAHRTAH